jgi:hypothetical protein
VKSKQKRRNPNKNPGNPTIKSVKSKQHETDFLFGFPGFSKESGKSKLKNNQIQTIMRVNPNKKAVFLFFGLR